MLRAGAMAALSADRVRPRPPARAAAAARRGRGRPAAARSAARLVGGLLAVGRRHRRRHGLGPRLARSAPPASGRWRCRWRVTLGAQLGVALPSLLVFGRLSLVGTVANLLAVPVAGLVMLYGLPAASWSPAPCPSVAPVVMRPSAGGPAWVDRGRHRRPPASSRRRRGRRSAWLVVMAAGRGGRRPCSGNRPTRCDDDRRDGRAPPDRRRRVDPARRGLRARPQLVGDGDRSLMVDEFEGDDVERPRVVDAAQTPPFLTERRVVVLATSGGSTPTSCAPLVAYLADPLPTTELVLGRGGGRLAKALDRRGQGRRRAGHAHRRRRSGPGTARPGSPLRRRTSGVELSTGAAGAIAERLGEDVGAARRHPAQTLAATYGGSHQLGPGDVEPFLGRRRRRPAVGADRRHRRRPHRAGARPAAARMIGPGDRHPLQLMAILHGHYGRLARLDGADATSEAEAADGAGHQARVPGARRRSTQYRKLGGGGGATGDRPAGHRRPRSARAHGTCPTMS